MLQTMEERIISLFNSFLGGRVEGENALNALKY